MPVTIDGTNGITTPTYGGTDTSEYLVPVTGFKNRIINGAMMIDQRNAGASVTVLNTRPYNVDRFYSNVNLASKLSVQQNAGSVTPPVGFKNYLGYTSLSSYSSASTDYFQLNQIIEGLNVADLNFGSANASTVTLSFWVRSSLTGTFSGALRNASTYDRSYIFTYTISSANTWEYKTITISGDTTGTWNTSNDGGFNIIWDLGSGSSFNGTANAWQAGSNFKTSSSQSVVGTNGATFYITGVQLEKGSTATSFDYRPYGTELQLCQRYFWKLVSGNQLMIGSGSQYNNTSVNNVTQFPVTMRTSPSIIQTTGTDYYIFERNSGQDGFNSFNGYLRVSDSAAQLYNDQNISGTAGQAGIIFTGNASAYLGFSAEL